MTTRVTQTKKVLTELIDNYIDLHRTIKTTTQTAAQTKKLWREGNKSNLIRIGMACILFPDPSPVTEIVGAGFLVAGAVQQGIQKRALYVGDIKKNLENIQRELNTTKFNLKI